MPTSLPTFRLDGRAALVTGASSGLGVRFARVLAEAGARVVLAARRVERLETLRDELLGAGHQAFAVAMDVSDEASVIAAYDAATDRFGEIDTVVANAGTSGEGSFLTMTAQDVRGLLDVN